MQVVSGRDDQLARFIDWFNQSNTPSIDPLVRATITHFWFITLHPFDDGNGRITRALTDLALAQADAQSIRLYAMSAAILASRSDYYRILETSQKGELFEKITRGWAQYALSNFPQRQRIITPSSGNNTSPCRIEKIHSSTETRAADAKG